MDHSKYIEYIVEEFKRIVAIPSPTGMTRDAALYSKAAFEALGFKAELTRKGCVLVGLGGEGEPLLLSAHLDTLGGMVNLIKGSGALRITGLGGVNPNSIETENCTVVTRGGKTFSGVCQLENASVHVNPEARTKARDFESLEILLDELVFSKEDTEKLGIGIGDFVCFDPRAVYTETGYLKSRFLDDKLSAAMLLGLAKYIKDTDAKLRRKVYVYLTVYEEIGHGGSASIPADVTDMIAVDMGCVGKDLKCRETQVSICAKDSSGPSDFFLTNELVECAKANGIDYAIDIYPGYGSDADTALRAGYDIRHCVIGSGVYASHGYERTHRDGIRAAFDLLCAYTLEK